MAKTIKVFCTDNADWYAQPLLQAGGFELVPNSKLADVVLFTGGEDVSPSLYGEEIGSRTHFNAHRDAVEAALFEQCRQLNKPMIGVCRGAQFLTVMSGGKLIQHVSNHGVRYGHEIDTIDGRSFVVSSTHHQMMLPYGIEGLNYELLGWANGLSTTYLNGNDEEIQVPFPKPNTNPEPEVVRYPDTRCLCFQYHPEIMRQDSEGVQYFVGLVRDHVKQ